MNVLFKPSNLLHGVFQYQIQTLRDIKQPIFTLKGVIIITFPMFSDVPNGKYSEKNLSEKDILGHEI